MWTVINRTPFAADRTWLQDKACNKIWLVVVKASFDLTPDGPRVADEQMPVLQMGVHNGKPGVSSLKYEADLFGVKPATDVLLNGSAWAARGGFASHVDVQFAVGPLSKRLQVSGERLWERGLVGRLTASEPQPFHAKPIIYERAYGGWDRKAQDPSEHRLDGRNPAGTGFVTSAGHAADVRLPSVEYPDKLIRAWSDRPAPAGFNAVDSAWSPRRELAGNYDENWLRDEFPLWSRDFDVRYHNCAPADQQVPGYLRGGERVDLVNLSPDGRVTFSLPKFRILFQTRFGRRRVNHEGQLCTVLLEPDIRRLMMAWQMSFICNHRNSELDETIVAARREA